jgi:V/A-type H+/Na+-transporting ATPase subunit K
MSILKKDLKWKIAVSMIILFALTVVGGVFFIVQTYAQESQHATVAAANPEQNNSSKVYGLFAAAAAFGLGTLAAGYAIANVGSAAMGAMAEKPEIAGQALIFVALAEGLVVFSFITALMILGKV